MLSVFSQIISDRNGSKSRRGQKRNRGCKNKGTSYSQRQRSGNKVHADKEAVQSSLLLPAESLSNDVIVDAATPLNNVVLEKQSKGTIDSQTKRSGNKVDAENDDEKFSVPRDAVFKGAGATNASKGKQLNQMRIKVDTGFYVEGNSLAKQWGCKKRRGERQMRLLEGIK